MGLASNEYHQADIARTLGLYAVLIREQMRRQGLSVKRLGQEGLIRKNHQNGFYARLEAGKISLEEFQKLNERLQIDPIRAALAMVCFENADSYDDPCCRTSAQVAMAMANHLPEEIAACDGEFEGIREQLCVTIARRTSSAIANHHRLIESKLNGDGFAHAYG